MTSEPDLCPVTKAILIAFAFCFSFVLMQLDWKDEGERIGEEKCRIGRDGKWRAGRRSRAFVPQAGGGVLVDSSSHVPLVSLFARYICPVSPLSFFFVSFLFPFSFYFSFIGP